MKPPSAILSPERPDLHTFITGEINSDWIGYYVKIISSHYENVLSTKLKSPTMIFFNEAKRIELERKITDTVNTFKQADSSVSYINIFSKQIIDIAAIIVIDFITEAYSHPVDG